MKNRKNISMLSLNLVIFILFSIFLFSIFYQIIYAYSTKKKVEGEIVEIENKIKEYENKKIKLKENMNIFLQEEKMEKIARERLNLKKEGEVTFKIVD